jgi:hypothetical protein
MLSLLPGTLCIATRRDDHQMNERRPIRTAVKWAVRVAGFALGAYATYIGAAWAGYGRAKPGSPDESDAALDRVMPIYEVAERWSVHVAAPADVTFAAACEADVMRSPLIRAIFRTRELVLGNQPDTAERPRGILAFTKSIGWGVLADAPGREIVMGAVTRPWNPDVVFRPLTPETFAAFNEPDYVKIVWTLRADPIGRSESIFRHETRVVTTDGTARAKFRRYWAIFSPGIKLVRWLLLPQVRTEAERRAAAA